MFFNDLHNLKHDLEVFYFQILSSDHIQASILLAFIASHHVPEHERYFIYGVIDEVFGIPDEYIYELLEDEDPSERAQYLREVSAMRTQERLVEFAKPVLSRGNVEMFKLLRNEFGLDCSKDCLMWYAVDAETPDAIIELLLDGPNRTYTGVPVCPETTAVIIQKYDDTEKLKTVIDGLVPEIEGLGEIMTKAALDCRKRDLAEYIASVDASYMSQITVDLYADRDEELEAFRDLQLSLSR